MEFNNSTFRFALQGKGVDDMTNSPKPMVFVVDDERQVRESIVALVETMGIVTRTYSSTEEFLSSYTGEAGCVITDLRMPGRSGMELLTTLNDRGWGIPVVVVSGFVDVPVSVEVMQQGAINCLEKPFRANDMWNAIRQALQRDAETRRENELRREINRRIDLLSPEERSVMELIVDGLSNKAVALRMGLGLRTVETRRHTIFEKMEVDSVARLVQAVMLANGGRPTAGITGSI